MLDVIRQVSQGTPDKVRRLRGLITVALLLAASASSVALAASVLREGPARPMTGNRSADKVPGPGQRLQTLTVGRPTFFVSPSGTASVADSSPIRPMSLQTALNSVPDGAAVHVRSGSYQQIYGDTPRSSWVTFTGAGDRTAPSIAGALLFGAQYVRFVDVKFTSLVWINWSIEHHAGQRGKDIELLNSTFDCGSTRTTPVTQGIYVRGESENVTISGDLIERCVNGFISQAQDPFSTNIRITHCTFQHLTGDAIDLGGLSGVIIDHNIIRDVADPANLFHDDGIQLFGHVQNVTITDNILSNSRDQLIFIQDAVAGDASHSSINRNILIAHNLIYGAGAIAVQDVGGQNVRFVGNTIWDSHFYSMLIIKSYYTHLEPTVKLVDNIIQGLTFYHAGAQFEDYNLLTEVSKHSAWGRHDIIDVNPRFVDPLAGDFALETGSPGYDQGNVSIARSLDSDFSANLFGRRSANDNIGALEPGDPLVAYGSEEFGPVPLI